MTYREFEIFIEVCKTKNMTQAGKNLYMSQPAVSYIINKLEKKYKHTLFTRDKNGLQITSEGNTLLNYALQLVYNHNLIKKTLSENIESIKLGVVNTIAEFYLPKYISEYKTLKPNSEIKVIAGNLNYIFDALSRNEIEIALIDSEYYNKDFEIIPYHYDLYMGIVSTKNELSIKNEILFEDFIKNDLLLREIGSVERTIFDQVLKSKSIEKKPLYEFNSNNAIISGVIENLGVSIMPSTFLNRSYYKKRIKLIRISDVNLYRRFFFVINKRSKNNKNLKFLMDVIDLVHKEG